MSYVSSDVIIDNLEDKGVIILNRSKALNALNLSMIDKIHKALVEWEHQKALVIIKSAEEKSFCAGADVRAVAEAGLNGNKEFGRNFFRKEYVTNNLISSYKIPYISLVDGIVMGGGVGLSVHGRYMIITEKTVFAMPETLIGFFPDVGGSFFLSRLNGKLGWYLAMTGQRLRGSDVFQAGIGNHFCDSKDLKDLESALLNNCSNDVDVQKTIEIFSKKNLPLFSLKNVMDKINEYFAADNVEKIIAKLERDDTKWARETIMLLNKMSPTSLKVTLKQLDLGKSYNLSKCLQMEYNLCLKFLNNKDFYEGVRALLIDKDRRPNWQPKRLQDVSNDEVDEYFAKLPKLLLKL